MAQTTLADLNSINTKVTTRTTSWLDLSMRAWGGEFKAPDHGIYRFSNGREFDSTDKSTQGIYSPDNYTGLLLEGRGHNDMVEFLLVEDGTQLDQN